MKTLCEKALKYRVVKVVVRCLRCEWLKQATRESHRGGISVSNQRDARLRMVIFVWKIQFMSYGAEANGPEDCMSLIFLLKVMGMLG